MNIKVILFPLTFFLCTWLTAAGQQEQTFQLKSPNGKLVISIATGKQTTWSVKHQNDQVINASAIALELADGKFFGKNATLVTTEATTVDTFFETSFYKKKIVKDNYNQLKLNFKENFSLVFRAYNDGVAYRFSLDQKTEIKIKNESVNFVFSNDKSVLIPYVRDLRGNEQYISSFEALYDDEIISTLTKDSLSFLPLLVKINDTKKAVILEADLKDYPGMFITKNDNALFALKGVFAPYPLKETNGGFKDINYMVSHRADYIAQIAKKQDLPWRAMVISENDKDLLNNDLVQKLAEPNQIKDTSWIKPGKVAWDWWNDWNLSKVNFKAGINTETYKYYIDFAAKNKIEYIVLDEGWSNEADMMQVSAKINLKEIIAHAKQKKVDVILWASWYALSKVLDHAFEHYAAMGIKGFKIDFLDRDDQKMVSSVYDIAKKAAKNHLLIDFHGVYKPTGLQRTYPNVINFEGVKGLENVKWTPDDDVPKYDVTMPFIRMIAGPIDYTPGAMRNATKENFKPSSALPMSQGTRCHQLAMYIIFEAPLQMMADSPTAYYKEQESTRFIANVPTVFDETVAIDGKIGEFLAIARKKNNVWFAGGMSNWTARTLTINLSFLNKGQYEAEIFKDGLNADKDATDYKRVVKNVNSSSQLILDMASGGGFAIKFTPTK